MNIGHNPWVQATPGYAFVFVVGQCPGAPDPDRSATSRV